MPEAHRSVADSPVRFEIMKEGMKGKRKRRLSPEVTPLNAKSLGVSSIGYAQAPERWIFQGKGILHLNAIMLTMEMDKVRLDTAPSVAGEQAVIQTYRDLGIAANKIATYLRKRGYSAHAAHPLAGPTLYPPLTQMAGLGWLSASGLMITPEHGPRVRLAAVFTSIENLPFSTHNDHAWVADFCAECGICIRQCPVGAILPEPIQHANGQITRVDNNRYPTPHRQEIHCHT